MTVQVLDCYGFGFVSGIIEGMEWAVLDSQRRGKPAVLSMSLGSRVADGGRLYDTIIKWAHDLGVLTVVAAGNNNADACSYSPAATPLALTVGATTSDDAKWRCVWERNVATHVPSPARGV